MKPSDRYAAVVTELVNRWKKAQDLADETGRSDDLAAAKRLHYAVLDARREAERLAREVVK